MRNARKRRQKRRERSRVNAIIREFALAYMRIEMKMFADIIHGRPLGLMCNG